MLALQRGTGNMTEGTSESKKKDTFSDLELHIQRLFTNEGAARNTADQVLTALGEAAQRLPGQLGSALKMMGEFVQEFTNVKGMQIQLQSFRILDLQIETLREADVPIKQGLPVGRIDSMHLGEKIHFQVGVGEGAKDLHMNIIQGMSLIIDLGFLGKQTVPVQGSAKVTRDAKGELVVVATTRIPGIELPVSVNVPLRNIVDEIRKQRK